MSLDLSTNFTVYNSRTGEVAGWYSANEKQCVQSESEPKSKPAPNPLADATTELAYTPSTIERIQNWLFGTSEGAKRCTTEEGTDIIDVLRDGGIRPGQTDAHAGDDAYVILPETDAGVPILPDPVFESVDATGDFDFIQPTRLIELTTGIFGGSGLQNENLYAEIGWKSTPGCIANMPQDPDKGCFSWLVNTVPSQPEYGLVCYDSLDATGMPIPHPDYGDFAFCPDDQQWQILAYYSLVMVECNQPNQTNPWVYTEIDTTPQEVLDATELATQIESVCGPEANPLEIDLPREQCNSTGSADITFTLRFMADARNKHVEDMIYQNCLYIAVKSRGSQ